LAGVAEGFTYLSVWWLFPRSTSDNKSVVLLFFGTLLLVLLRISDVLLHVLVFFDVLKVLL